MKKRLFAVAVIMIMLTAAIGCGGGYLENIGDAVFRRALNKLFKEEKDPVEIIKWKDLYEGLEDALDACEQLADTVRGVMVKNA